MIAYPPIIYKESLFIEVSVEQTLESLAVTGFILKNY